MSPVGYNDAEDALQFAEALLDHVYVLRLRFQKFKERRAERIDRDVGEG